MKWLVVHVGGQKWTVYLVSARSKYLTDEDTGEPLDGRCVYSKNRICINRELDEEARQDILLHELLHALLYVSGADKVYGGDAEKDEQLVTALTPILHRLLKDLGFRFPRYVVN